MSLGFVTTDSCPYPWEWAMVTADGAVRPCCYGLVVGNLHDNNLEEIWNGRTMLEVRYFIDQHRLHSVCRGAACVYSQVRANAPVTEDKMDDCRYIFENLAVARDADHLEVAGKVVNKGEAAWFLMDEHGKPCIPVGARVIKPGLLRHTQTSLLELRCPLPGDILFPGESAPFKFRVPCYPRAQLQISVRSEGSFWLKDRGPEPLVIPM